MDSRFFPSDDAVGNQHDASLPECMVLVCKTFTELAEGNVLRLEEEDDAVRLGLMYPSTGGSARSGWFPKPVWDAASRAGLVSSHRQVLLTEAGLEAVRMLLKGADFVAGRSLLPWSIPIDETPSGTGTGAKQELMALLTEVALRLGNGDHTRVRSASDGRSYFETTYRGFTVGLPIPQFPTPLFTALLGCEFVKETQGEVVLTAAGWKCLRRREGRELLPCRPRVPWNENTVAASSLLAGHALVEEGSKVSWECLTSAPMEVGLERLLLGAEGIPETHRLVPRGAGPGPHSWLLWGSGRVFEAEKSTTVADLLAWARSNLGSLRGFSLVPYVDSACRVRFGLSLAAGGQDAVT